ncbi:2111_t:CDS:2 [Scutellospora calospora]|uniref:2111_t:CDS:1 n=1 Tax=Scutellospora calospora TaxID=85575 RepID=A0ACA9L0M1_9GLOM|nr:2111_t:CDS:2 [Scutellospora calospora]
MSKQKEENIQSNLEDPLLKNKEKNKEISSMESDKENKTCEIEKNLENKQKHVNTIHDLSNKTNTNKSNKESDDQQPDQEKSNPTKDKEMKMETESLNTDSATLELEENISNTDKAKTTSVSTKKKKGNKRKLQASNNGN